MKKIKKLDFLFINQYVYQLQNRFSIFEKQNNAKTSKITESVFCTTWSLKKYSFFLLRKKLQKKNLNLQDLTLIKQNSTYVSHFSLLDTDTDSIQNKSNKFISKKITEYLLLKQLLLQVKTKKYNYSNKLRTKNFLTVAYKSNLVSLNSLLIKCFLLYFFIYKLSYTVNAYIIHNHYRRLYLNLNCIEVSKKLIINKKMNTNKDLILVANSIYSDTIKKNPKFSILWLPCLDTTIQSIFVDKMEKILTIRINSNFVKKGTYLVTVKKNSQNVKQDFMTCFQFIVVKKNKKGYQNFFTNLQIKINKKYFTNFYKSNFLILKSKISNFKKNSYFNSLYKIKLKFPIKFILSNEHQKLKLIVPCTVYNFPNRFGKNLKRFLPLSKSMNQLIKTKDMSLQEKKNSFCFKFFQINFKKETFLISLDKKFAIFKLKQFLLYLVFLKPKYELYLIQDYSFVKPNYSKHDAINVLIKKLKINSKYFVHFNIQDSNNYVSIKKTVTKNINNVRDYFPDEVKIKPPLLGEKHEPISINLNLSGFQLKMLLTKINLNSTLFQYLVKNLKTPKFNFIRFMVPDKGRQKYLLKNSKLTVDNYNEQWTNIKWNETKTNNKSLFLNTSGTYNKIKSRFFSQEVKTKPTLYPLILFPDLKQTSPTMTLSNNYEAILPKFLTRKKNINYLFFNILFSEISLKLKHYILIKNANRYCLALNSVNPGKNIHNVVKINLILLNLTSLNLNSLPEFVWHANQIVILKDDSNLIYECLNIFKNFLYLHGFFVEFNQIKVGHTLFNYNKNSPGLNFLGFFIQQYKYKTDMNLQFPNNLVGNQNTKSFFYLKKKNLKLMTKRPLAWVEPQHNQKSSYKFDVQARNKNLTSQLSIAKSDLYKVERTLKFLTSTKNNKTELNNFNINKFSYNLRENPALIIHNQQIFDQSIITIVHPSKNEIKIHMHKLKQIIKNSASFSQENLILKLSPRIRIWSYYYHLISNKKILYYCDYLLFKMLWRWSCRRHPSKNKKWVKYKYFHQINGKKWIFGIYKNTSSQLISLPNHSDIKLLKL